MSISMLLASVFGLSELSLVLFRRSKRSAASTGSDKNSLLLFWIVIPVCITAAIMCTWYTPALTHSHTPGYTGAAVVVAGLIIRWLAILQLGRSFTVDIAIANNQQLKTDGLYRIVRHPSYTGLFLVIAGLGLSMNNIFSILIITIPVAIVLAYRIHIEEKMLAGAFGEAYTNYAQRTKRLLPWIY